MVQNDGKETPDFKVVYLKPSNVCTSGIVINRSSVTGGKKV